MTLPPDASDPAADLLAAMDERRDAPPALAALLPDFERGRALQARINQLRRDRGDQMVGYKIGFTNRTIWPLYGVHAPIWAPVWSQTLHQLGPSSLAGADGDDPRPGTRIGPLADLAASLNRPRLEPEIVLGLNRRPPPGVHDVAALEDCIAWVAHGFEVVQSPWPDWRFSAGQAMASQGLHGALLLGPKRAVTRTRGLAAALANLEVTLLRDGQPIAEGQGRLVLDGPVQALGFWLEAAAGENSLAAPFLVSTGTLTDAQPIATGQHWQTRFRDRDGALAACLEAPVAGLTVAT